MNAPRHPPCLCVRAPSLQASFGRPITKDEFKTILFPASMHGLGHIAANISFAAVAISLTHTVKTLEPVFNVAMSKLVLGTSTSVPVALSLLPITLGVAAASASELSFNWTGFISAMLSNLTFSFRAVRSTPFHTGNSLRPKRRGCGCEFAQHHFHSRA